MNGLSCGEESMTICSAVLIQYQRVTDRQTDRQTERLYLRHASAWLTHVKTASNLYHNEAECRVMKQLYYVTQADRRPHNIIQTKIKRHLKVNISFTFNCMLTKKT